MLILLPSAGTAADRELQPKITTSSHTCCNTHVCVQRSCLCDESWPLGGRSGATFTIKPVACCVLISWEVVNDASGASVRVERTVKRLWGLDNCYRCRKKRCTWLFQGVNIRYQLPEVLTAPGIKPPGLTDRRNGGTGEPVPVKCAK